MNVLLACCAVLILLFGALSFNVSRIKLKRLKSSTVSDAAVTKAVRAHGNAAEYMPLFIALFLYADATDQGGYWPAVAVVFTISRALHAAGMFLIPNVMTRHPLRAWGAMGTYVCLFTAGILLLVQAVR